MTANEKKRKWRRSHYKRNRAKQIGQALSWSKANPERRNKTRRIYRRKWREAVLTKFKRKCAKCGYKNVLALQIDHVRGNGREDRKKYSNGATVAYLQKVFQGTISALVR